MTGDRPFPNRPFSIRVSAPSDLDAVGALLVASYSKLLAASYDGAVLERSLPFLTKAHPGLLASGSYYVAEEASGHLVGCGGWTRAAPGSGQVIDQHGHIRHFATHPAWTGRGVGAALLARCISEAGAVGITTLHCFSTLNGEPFYRAAGFKTIGPIDVPMGPHSFQAVLMRH
jgi:N-acetylglutamate synthase-like GNAT family acetyltransferase